MTNKSLMEIKHRFIYKSTFKGKPLPPAPDTAAVAAEAQRWRGAKRPSAAGEGWGCAVGGRGGKRGAVGGEGGGCCDSQRSPLSALAGGCCGEEVGDHSPLGGWNGRECCGGAWWRGWCVGGCGGAGGRQHGDCGFCRCSVQSPAHTQTFSIEEREHLALVK